MRKEWTTQVRVKTNMNFSAATVQRVLMTRRRYPETQAHAGRSPRPPRLPSAAPCLFAAADVDEIRLGKRGWLETAGQSLPYIPDRITNLALLTGVDLVRMPFTWTDDMRKI
jgi:hypothetical protein